KELHMSIYYSDHPQTPYRPPRTTWFAWLGPLALLLGLVAFLGWWLASRWHTPLDPNAMPRTVTPRGDLAADEKATIELFKLASPSVVHITTLALRQDYFTLDVQQIPQGTGSGFIWDRDGHVVTNYHVIQAANAARVTLGVQSTYDAQLVGHYAD